MKNDFIKINLLPGFKEDKFISSIIYQIVLVVLVIFVLFYLMYMPFKSANDANNIVNYNYIELQKEHSFYTNETNQFVIPEIDIVYQDTINIVNQTRINLRIRSAQIISLDVDGFEIDYYEFDLDGNSIYISGSIDGDTALLKLEEALWDIYWVDTVELTGGGPGGVAATITFTVGEDNEEE